ncbi:amidohydrolase, YtcJ-related protein [Citrifermentans bemidjiense Bem]|uniref:Amidohydrolase, YtcJ-related protein n=1 Tax=Citrifermentans bemidjiense (strain ATCC BAA-1014 / DSM 16622 / JCM 12645 / Bem) TaxID=404380 RepID=B5ECC1_CITBB|nr:amidohydrolase [Citrifermentans bemidjiense]ACH37549.1 amidohydrolase, YtcJ-related protein [Citrifermentans bemidjiense Bem]
MKGPELVLYNGTITTLDENNPEVTALAVSGGRVIAIGGAELLQEADEGTKRIDLKKHRAIPGLNDSHIHVIRGGLNYNMELRWDGVPSLHDALGMLREQARRTPPPQWVRVIGGWTEFQFAERRMPTLEEVNQAAPDTPVFILHLYDRALVNKAALRALGYNRDTPDPPGSEIQRDKAGNPTGLLIARPNAMLLYASLAKGPKLPYQDQLNSTRHFMRELNRLGLTSAIDAGGGFQNYPDDYRVIEELSASGRLTLRIAYNLFTQHPKSELEDFTEWVRSSSPGSGDDFYRHNGAGEMLVFSAADFEDFLEPRPDLPPMMEQELSQVVRLLAENRWPFRLHATYNESITRFLDVFEAVNRDVPFDGLRWFFDHAETITPENLERVRNLGGGIAIQDRMAFQGEYFRERYGRDAAANSPPFARMLDMGIPVGAGTDATRVASYNPWVALYWLVSGRTVGKMQLYPEQNRIDRLGALRLYTVGSSWFSGEEEKKGRLVPGQLADLAVLSADYFKVAEEEIPGIESVLTIVGGKVVHGAGDFGSLAPPPLPVSPDWSPVGSYGGYHSRVHEANAFRSCCRHAIEKPLRTAPGSFPWGGGCDCFAF